MAIKPNTNGSMVVAPNLNAVVDGITATIFSYPDLDVRTIELAILCMEQRLDDVSIIQPEVFSGYLQTLPGSSNNPLSGSLDESDREALFLPLLESDSPVNADGSPRELEGRS